MTCKSKNYDSKACKNQLLVLAKKRYRKNNNLILECLEIIDSITINIEKKNILTCLSSFKCLSTLSRFNTSIFFQSVDIFKPKPSSYFPSPFIIST